MRNRRKKMRKRKWRERGEGDDKKKDSHVLREVMQKSTISTQTSGANKNHAYIVPTTN